MRHRSVSGKRALVTGGSSGIGGHVALELAGAEPKVGSSSVTKRIGWRERRGRTAYDLSGAFACLCNVGSQEGVGDRMAATVRGRIGGVDIAH